MVLKLDCEEACQINGLKAGIWQAESRPLDSRQPINQTLVNLI